MRILVALWLACIGVTPCQAVTRLTIEADHIVSAQGEARASKLVLSLAGAHPSISLQTSLQPARMPDFLANTLAKEAEPPPLQLALSCEGNSMMANAWQCAHGKLQVQSTALTLNLPFSLRLNQETPGYSAQLVLHQASFSDAQGLHAADKLETDLTFHWQPDSQGWQWRGDIHWRSGEVFWQPFYYAASNDHLSIQGHVNDADLRIDQAKLHLASIGDLSLNADYGRQQQQWQHLHLDASGLQLKGLYPLLQAALQAGAPEGLLSKLEIEGQMDVALDLDTQGLQQARVRLHGVDMEDQAGRFAFYKLHADLPWDYEQKTTLSLGYAGGRLLRLPLGETHLSADMQRYALTSDTLRFPILDGAVVLQQVSAAWLSNALHGHFSAYIEPLDMRALSQAFGWPTMQGELAASIPKITYSNGDLYTEGAIGLHVFNGNLVIDHLALHSMLGRTPVLEANIRMRAMDLASLTSTFSFGAIEGKLDMDIQHLQLINWQPVQMDAMVQTSSGDFRKKISQRAVENISALGGAGAAAAIQRSVLRFFNTFNYEKIGLGCRLRNDRCEMQGIASTPGGYVIVKGSGIPAITVMGYNQTVHWSDLLDRLKRVIANNLGKP